MSTTIDRYREAKNNYLKLRNQAKKELIARFHGLGNEMFHIQRELLDDFGEKIAMPTKAKKISASKTPSAQGQTPAVAVPSSKMTAITKRIDSQKRKLAEVQAAGKPAKAAQDRLYELEDELRLLRE